MLENVKWIRCGMEEAPLIRKSFFGGTVNSAEIYICGLGMFELYINGKKVSEDLLTPVWSEYEKRKYKEFFSPSHRIYYMRYDVSEYLSEGLNTVGIMLGNGWYNQYVHKLAGDMEYDKPKLAFRLIMKRGDKTEEVSSDETLRYAPGHIYFNNIYYGEKQDLRLLSDAWMKNGFNDSLWSTPEVIEAPDAKLCLQSCPPDRRMKFLPAQLISESDNTKIYDMGENTAGWVRVRVFGKSGERVRVRYAEELYKDGTMNFSTAGWPGQIQAEEYICSGETLECEPHFTFHGFRYCEITGDAEVLYGVCVHSDVRPTAEFECDNDVLNWFYNAYIRTQLCNMHCGVPSDCPQRERLGYTGDGQLCCDAGMLLFDSREFYRKWIYDIYDCQDVNTGHVHHTAPSYGTSGGGPGGWGCAIAVVPYFFMKHYGETEILREGYPKMLKWVEYMKSRSEDNLVVREEEIGWCLGDWCTPADEVLIPPPYVNTYYLIKALGYIKEIATAIGEKFPYEALIEDSKKAIVREYYDEKSERFAGGVQGADVFALDLGLGSENTMRRVAKHYEETLSFDTGIFATYILIGLLFDRGYASTASRLLCSENENTFGWMKNHNATTLWERWNGGDYHPKGNSHNHPMFGACVSSLFYKMLGFGIFSDELKVEPHLPDNLSFVCGKITFTGGNLSAKYERKASGLSAVITVHSEKKAVFKYNGTVYNLRNGENLFEL